MLGGPRPSSCLEGEIDVMRADTELRNKLLPLDLRREGEFTLRSGTKSNVFWDIEKLSDFSYEVRREIARLFAEIIGQRPKFLVGIPKGGMVIGEMLGLHWNMCCFTAMPERPKGRKSWEELMFDNWRRDVLLVDDVLTTGGTIRNVLHYLPFPITRVAVLINRNGMTELEGVPIISGVVVDIVGESG